MDTRTQEPAAVAAIPEVARVTPFDSIRQADEGGREYWSARDLMPLLGYDRWERFEDAIDRAVAAIDATGNAGRDHIRGAAKMVEIGSGSQRKIIDHHLTRFGAYMVAMNSDPRKPAVAQAQTYFAVRTREAETAPDRFQIPADYPTALRAAAEQAERAIAAEAQVRELTPKAATFDTFLSSVGDYSVNEAAKILSRDHDILTGQGRLFTFMERLGWIYRDARGKPVPYQTQIDLGRLIAKAQFHYHPETGEVVADAPQVRVTAKGLDALRTKYLAGSGGAA